MTEPKQAAYEATEKFNKMSPKKIEATVWKRLAQARMGEEEANEAFKEIVQGAVDDLSANTANTVGVSDGVFESAATSVSDDLSSGVFE